jgi:hypothetical protein
MSLSIHDVTNFIIKWLWIFLILIGLEGSLLPISGSTDEAASFTFVY